MKTVNRTNFIILAAVLLIFINGSLRLCAQGTAFTYQGRLNLNGAPASGSYDFTFTLFDSLSGGTQQGSTIVDTAVGISNGVFTVALDFGNQFPGNARWLEVGVRTNGVSTFTTLTPRQALTATPYAVQSANAASASSVAAENISGTLSAGQLPSNVITNGATQWQTVAGTNLTAAPNQAYLLTNGVMSSIALPTNSNVGDVVTISGVGSNGWQATPGIGQSIVGYPPAAEWTRDLNAPVDLWSAVASSADGTRLIVVSGTANDAHVYTSTNTGATWTSNYFGIDSKEFDWQSVASSADGTMLVAADSQGLIVTSTNGGADWSESTNRFAEDWTSVASSADGSKLVAVSSSGIIATSTNAGVNWSTNNNAPASNWVAVASSADGTRLVAAADTIYTSSDSGVTWTAINTGPVHNGWTSVASSADGSRVVATFGGGPLGFIFFSSDFGATWSTNSNAPNGPFESIACSADGSKIVAAANEAGPISPNGGLIFSSSDFGMTWRTDSAPTAAWQSVACSADGNKVIAAEQAEIWTSTVDFPGTAGTTTQFQYLGNGVWEPLGVAGSQIVGTIPQSDINLPSDVVINGESGVTLSGIFAGNGTGLTLSPNVAVQNGENIFSGNQIFTNGAVYISGESIARPVNPGWTALNEFDDVTGTAFRGFVGLDGVGLTGNSNQMFVGTLTSHPIAFYTANTARMQITAAGLVGIGTTIPDSLLTVNGSADKPGGGSWGTFSDARLKDVGEKFTHGLESLEQLQPVHYHYKPGNPLDLPARPDYVGLVAQQVQQAIPEAVEKNKDGYLVVNNDPIIWTMLNAIKQLKSENERLEQKEAEISEMRKELNELKKLVAAKEGQK